MRLVIGLIIAALGVVLLVMGFNASQSLGSDISKFFTGNPTDRSVWFMIGTAYLGTGQFVPFTATDPVWLVVGSVNLW